MDTKKYRVPTKDMYKTCNPKIFRFETTADLKPITEIIGQDRAIKSLSFGLDINHSAYNIYLSGAPGTGKATLAYETVLKKAKKEPRPFDWFYVNNFQSPDIPKALKLPAGQGLVFKQDLSLVVEEVIAQIKKP